ncbi:hypothetical protein V5799_011146 [Amblyomma americanum]|uniref:Uncharacterized protein n=1 Tax=Amblyomma americanum TaxID=6943 RepID=A0AAQ4EHX4_AMBAM
MTGAAVVRGACCDSLLSTGETGSHGGPRILLAYLLPCTRPLEVFGIAKRNAACSRRRKGAERSRDNRGSNQLRNTGPKQGTTEGSRTPGSLDQVLSQSPNTIVTGAQRCRQGLTHDCSEAVLSHSPFWLCTWSPQRDAQRKRARRDTGQL